MTVATLALRIDAPMQSWGVRSRFVERLTAAEPTKSGVVGLLAAASGVDRADDERVRELAALRMGIRVEREGLLESDYHVTQDVPNTEGKGHRSIVSTRYYLADALFLVALEGPVEELEPLERAVRSPHWPLYFGRKAFVPAAPLVERDGARRARWGTGLREATLRETLETHPWLEDRREQRKGIGPEEWLRTVVDAPAGDPGAELRHDRPESFALNGDRFRSRPVRAGHVRLTDAMINGAGPCT
ncbi:type I-E CRISPR-associated protein Cas5/CasD [Spirillospora sp. NPDC050679]